MSVETVVKATLEADATLVALATGGIWDYEETGRTGLNRTTTSDAFDASKRIKPCILVKLRSAVPDGELMDDANAYTSVRETVELWFYQDTGYTTITSMRVRAWQLLHTKRLTGMFQILWQYDVRQQRDTGLDASVERSDYVATVKRSV